MRLLVSFLFFLVVIGIVFAIVRAVIPLLGLPAPFPTIIYLVLLLICLVAVLSYLGGFGGFGLGSHCFGRLGC